MRKKFIGIAALAFVATLSAGVASVNAQADTENTLDGFAITATSVRLDDTTKEGVDSGLRFKVDVPMGATVTDAYTTITLTTAGGQAYTTEVEATVWRTDNSGWNTVLLDIPESDYATQVTAKAYATINGTAYATAAEMSSIAKTAAKAMANGTATADQVGEYVKNVSLELGQKQATMFVGDEDMQLTATVNPDYPVIWSSSNQNVATVDQTGKVSVVGKGAANVTATLGNKSVSCAITAYEKYEVDTVDEFMNMPTGDEFAYVTLTKDIDFAGTLIQFGATPSGTTYAPIGTLNSKFSGILDGNGYAIKNVNIIGNGGAAMYGCVFNFVDGTIKNLAADVTLTAVTKSAKDVGFIYYLYAGASVENCYIRFNTNATQYGNGNGHAVAAIATITNANGGVATIKNCVGVLDLTNLNSKYDGGFGGAASIVGGNSADTSTADIINCYGVTLTAEGDTVNTPKLDSNDTTSVNGAYNPGVVNKDTSSAYGSMYDMYVAAKTGMTAENGWNSNWSVANGVLKFGDETIFKVYEISTVADFMAMPLDVSTYNMLTQDIDFSGIVINQTEGYMTIGYPAGATHETPGASATPFAGVLDGNGYALQNVTVAPLGAYGGSNTTVGQPNLIYAICGTVKNLSAHISLTGLTVNSARFGGFTSTLQSGAHISNCYFELTSTHYVATNYPLAPLAGFVAASTGAITIENCVGVLNKVSAYRNGGLAGGLVGRISISNGQSVNINNCYAVEVEPNDNTSAAQVYVSANGWNAPTTLNNSTAHTTMADMLAAATTGMNAANGWNSLWTATADSLTFGQTVVYPQPQN